MENQQRYIHILGQRLTMDDANRYVIALDVPLGTDCLIINGGRSPDEIKEDMIQSGIYPLLTTVMSVDEYINNFPERYGYENLIGPLQNNNEDDA